MDNGFDLKNQMEQLRKRGSDANPDQLDGILNEARSLLKKTFQTELEDEARGLFRELRELQEKRTPDSQPDSQGDIAKRIERERSRIESGNADDMLLSLEGMGSILRELGSGYEKKPMRDETIRVLRTIAEKTPFLRQKVEDFLTSPATPQTTEATSLLNQIKRPAQGASSSSAESQPPPSPNLGTSYARPSQSGSDVNDRMSEARKKYYAGDYFEAIDLLSEVLRQDPGNIEAKQRLNSAEDNIKRGVVHESKVPFEARVSYGLAQSLERADRFDEARDKYQAALEAARAGGPELQNWQSALEALLRIDTFVIARQTRDTADKLAREDKWSDAIEKYESVLKLKEDDGRAKQNLDLLRKVQTQSETARVQLTLMTGSLVDMGKTVVELLATIRQLRPLLPESKLLATIEGEVQSKARSMKDRMLERAKIQLEQSRVTPSISERKRLLTESSRLLDYAVEMSVADETEFEFSQNAASELAKITNAEKSIFEAKRLINSDTDSDRMQAKDVLNGLREYNQDSTYRQLVSTLLRQYIDQAETALRNKKFREAERWIAPAQDEPFKILGGSEEVWKLSNRLEVARREPWIRLAGLSAGILVLVLILGALTTSMWKPLMFPPTQTSTFTPTMTVTVTITPEEEETPTPTFTPTPIPCYGAIKRNMIPARLGPDDNSETVFTLKTADVVEILKSGHDANGRLWYKILLMRGDLPLTGWVLGEYINAQCSPE